MKLSRRILTVTLLLFALALLEDQASAQCYGCGINPSNGCAMCEDHGPLGPGYEFCRVNNCTSCFMKFICELGAQAQPRVPATALKFDETTIRRIAKINPRYAATLAEINRQGGLTSPVRLTWSAVELKPQDVEWWLKADQGSAAFFSTFAEKARRANKRGIPQITYDVAAILQADANLATVRINAVKGTRADYRFSNLELTFANFGGAEPDQEQWVAVDWRIDRAKRSTNGKVRASAR